MNQEEIADIKARAQELKARYSERDQMFKEMEDMYLLEYDFGDEKGLRKTTSPDPRNALQGMVRLMTATGPIWKVPQEKNEGAADTASSKIEKLCAVMWDASNEISQQIKERDIALAALLYSEIQILVYDTEELAKAIKNPGERMQAEQAAKRSPLMFEVINPLCGYADHGLFGLRAYYMTQEMTVSDVRSRWGEDALKGQSSMSTVTYCDWWDTVNRVVWVEGDDEPLYAGPHGLKEIPIVAVIAEGSRLFKRQGQMDRQPVLYTPWKSKLWDRQNDALTVINTLTFNIGSNPLYLYRRNDPDKSAPVVDHETPGGVIVIDKDEDYQPFAKAVIDPAIMQVWEIAQQKMIEMTIYRQALGEPLGGQAPFSTVSLLAQAGRLPLVPYQKMAGFAVGKAMAIGLRMVKDKHKKRIAASSSAGAVEFDMSNIPENFNLTCTLDIAMPQDERQNVALAVQGTNGDNPLFSKRYARENYLGIGQPEQMEKEIAQEKYDKVRFETGLQELIMEAQAALQAKQAQMQPGAPMPGQGQQIPPEGLAQLAQSNQGAQPGLEGMPMAAPMTPMGEPPMPGGEEPREGGM